MTQRKVVQATAKSQENAHAQRMFRLDIWATALLLLGSSLAFAQQSAPYSLERSLISYTATTPNERWQGQTTLQSLTLTPTEEGLAILATVETGSFSSGNFIRDANARFVVFETGTFPTATLRGTLPLQGDLETLQSGSTTFSGTLALHGVSEALTFPVTLTRSERSVQAEGRFPVQLSTYGMKRPSLLGLLVDDRVEVALTVSVQLAAQDGSP